MIKRLTPIKVFFKDPDKKPWPVMVKELIGFGIKKRALPIDYFRKFLYRKDTKHYDDFLSLKEHRRIIESKKIVSREISELLNNKLSFSLLCRSANIPTTQMMSYNLKNRFVVDGKNQFIAAENDLILFFKTVLNETPKKHLFLKPLDGLGGEGCLLLTPDNLHNQCNLHARLLLTTSYIHECYIEQHPEINQIHPHAINTLRILHYIDNKNKIHILSSAMRFGVGNSIIDNISRGGFCIGINSQTGCLEKTGQQWVTNGGAVFYKHPDTGFVLEGFKVPYFDKACQLVKQVAPYFPNRLVGWDIAITRTGPIVLEGNQYPSLSMSEIAYGGFAQHPLFQELLKELEAKT